MQNEQSSHPYSSLQGGLSSLECTPKLLMELGGWRTFQEGKLLFENHKVLSVHFTSPILSGVVEHGTGNVQARLKITRQLTDSENLCSCRQARTEGTICPHVIALGFAWMHQNSKNNSNLNSKTPTDSTRTSQIKLQSAHPHSSVNIPSDGEPNTSKLRRILKTELSDNEVQTSTEPTSASPKPIPLELYILFPPDWLKSLKQDQVRLHIEASLSGKPPVWMDGIEKEKTTYLVDEINERLLRWIESKYNGSIPSTLLLNTASFLDFLELLIDYPRVSFRKKESLKILRSSSPLKLMLRVLDSGELLLEIQMEPNPKAELLQSCGSFWQITGNSIEFLGKLPHAYRLLRDGSLLLPRNAVGQLIEKELGILSEQIQVIQDPSCQKLILHTPSPKIRLHLDGLLAGLCARIEAIYMDEKCTIEAREHESHPPQSGWIPFENKPFDYFKRDWKAEEAALRKLTSFGFRPSERQLSSWVLNNENQAGRFLANALPSLQKDWEIIYSPRTAELIRTCQWVEPTLSFETSGQDWFEVGLNFTSSSQEKTGFSQLSIDDVRTLISKQISHKRLPNGHILFVPTERAEQFLEVLYDCQAQAKEGRYQLSLRFEGYMRALAEDQNIRLVEKNDQKQTEKKESPLELGEHFEHLLRPYQVEGAAWLHRLATHHFGGILADEMGLGKTLQVLTYLAWRKEKRLNQGPSLVVGPTSLVHNWVSEVRKFDLGLRVIALSGPDRHELLNDLDSYDLIIISYALLRRDVELLRNFEFDWIILDEAQHIKNRLSQNAQSVKSLKCKQRLVLTGTPMENSLFDLWSIFDFIMPGYLGPSSEFQNRYVSAITKQHDEQALRRLKMRIQPFILRRIKEQVARDLPEKIEQLVFCEMGEEQLSVYRSLLEAGRKELFELEMQKKAGQSRIAALALLTRLRQTCCHLELLPSIENKTWQEPSAKLEYLMELIQEVIEGEHRALIFSQFVSLLKLVEKRLHEEKIDYCYLDGATLDRKSEVDRFQEHSEIPLFLISLKAGGSGLNLTGADTVIHLDPWWNPAVEEQATARAHRIGQTRFVTSYKLIAQGTVEEKIIDLQNRKKELIDATVTSEEAFLSILSWDELKNLLE